eukprot:6605772-Prorocentrum_lima.AAC.1
MWCVGGVGVALVTVVVLERVDLSGCLRCTVDGGASRSSGFSGARAWVAWRRRARRMYPADLPGAQ